MISWSSGLWWPLMAFDGLHWPFWPWMNFLSKDQPLVIKSKQNWAVSNNQMSKPNSESKSPIYSTVGGWTTIFVKGKWKLKCEFKMDLIWMFVGPRCLVCSYYNLHQQVKSHKAKCFNLPQSWENFMPIYLLHRAMLCLFALLI